MREVGLEADNGVRLGASDTGCQQASVDRRAVAAHNVTVTLSSLTTTDRHNTGCTVSCSKL